MNLERIDRQSRLSTFVSIFILTIALLIFYSFRGEAGYEDSFIQLANLKSISELGEPRTYKEPLNFIIMLVFHKIFRMGYMVAYQCTLAFTLSIFLHLLMFCIRDKAWKLNHYFLIYLVSFLPFTLYLPYHFQEEFLCLSLILGLQAKFKLENIPDLLRLVGYSLMAILSSVSMFLFGYLFFVLWNTSQKVREKKTTVFFKKKNVPLRLLFWYFGFFLCAILWMWYADFYGHGTLGFLFRSFWDITSRLFPILITFLIGEYLLRSEKELNTLGTTAVVAVLILISVYYTYRSQYENIESFQQHKMEILNLKSSGKVFTDQHPILSSRLFSDYMFFQVGEGTLYHYANLKKNGYVLVSGVTNPFLTYLDKRSLGASSYYILDKDTVLIGKPLLNRVLEEQGDSEHRVRLQNLIRSYSVVTLPSEKFNKFLCSIFGL
jgi:hypothetical protein